MRLSTRSGGGRRELTGVRRLIARRSDDDEGFAMMTVILLIMICAAVSVLMLGAVVGQVKPTIFEAKNTRTLSAAQAGIDATLSELRAATTMIGGVPYGNPRKLPCTVAGPVVGAGTSLRYAASITYFSANPTTKDATWRANSKIHCTAGTGLATPPTYALISSQGSDAAAGTYAASVGNRAIESLYTFKVTNVNVAGGIIWNWGRLNCLKANGLIAGSTISYDLASNCSDDDAHLWIYDTDYTIKLASSNYVGSTNVLCLSGRPASTASTVDATLKKCNGTDTTQKWAWHDGARFYVVNADGRLDDTYCMSAGSNQDLSSGTKPLKVNNWCSGNTPSGGYDPDPRVGAGAASVLTQQVVSYLEFGRCFDVTNGDPNWPLLILYPCKQAPGTSDVLSWNHKWLFTEPAGETGTQGPQIITVNNGSVYCLTAPASPAVTPAYLTMKACTGGTSQKWVRYAQMGSYADSWTIRDSTGTWCIGVGTKAPAPTAGQTDISMWSTMVVAPCTGGPEQKWNAPSLNQDATLDNFKELN